jgi:hypothetical protein
MAGGCPRSDFDDRRVMKLEVSYPCQLQLTGDSS